MISRSKQIELILNDIDLDKIHTVKKALDWTWRDSNTQENRIPNTNEIEAVVIECLNKALESEYKIFRMGGFEAEVIDGVVGIKFIVEECNPLTNLFS